MKQLAVYNLEFPVYVNTLDIAGYKFRRIGDYETAFVGLQHIIEVSGSEFPIKLNTGTHQQTAIVEIPEKEEKAILPWAKESKFTKFHDVLLFISLFIGRNVFALNPGEEKYPLRPDPRGHFWGGQFRLSAQNDVQWRHKITGALKIKEEMTSMSALDYNRVDLGLEKTVCAVLDTINSKSWREKYDTGYFIFTFRQIIKQENIEQSFLLSWTLWEHFFTLHQRRWLDNRSIEQINGDKKIAFILHHYFRQDINDFARRRIRRLTKARNRLVHFGPIPENVDFDEIEMFIRLTEQLIAIVLGLEPSNVLNSFDHLQNFLRGKK
ncbi:hypothetical protein KA005_72390 [bacterium]|nr:hypothetical protein [bacterium]